MPFTIEPSACTKQAWGKCSRLPIRFDLTALCITPVLLIFCAVNTAQSIPNYIDETHGATNRPSECEFAAIIICLNILTPVATVLNSTVNMYLYSSAVQLLSPALVLATSSTLFSAWVVLINYWVEFGPEGKWNHHVEWQAGNENSGWRRYARWVPFSRGLNVSGGVHVMMLIGGFLLMFLYATYMLLAAFTLLRGLKFGTSKGSYSTIHTCPEEAEYSSTSLPRDSFHDSPPHMSVDGDDDEEEEEMGRGTSTSAVVGRDERETQEACPLLD